MPRNIVDYPGDIFESGCDMLVNPVNSKGVMGKGLAKSFKSRYPVMFKVYNTLCQSHDIIVPGNPVIYHGQHLEPQTIVLFPTKDHWNEKSKMWYITKGLKNLSEKIYDLEPNPYKSICFPKLGCGQGGLNWKDVRPHIVNFALDNKDMTVLCPPE